MHQYLADVTVTGHRGVTGNEAAPRMDVEGWVGIAHCDHVNALVNDAAPSARWRATRGFSDGSSAGRIVIGTREGQQQNALARFNPKLRKLRLVIGNHFSTKRIALRSIEDRKVSSYCHS